MRKIILGRTQESVSVISLGTWSYGGGNKNASVSVGWAEQDDADSSAALLQAWKSGIHHWDTADVYGNGRSESIIGAMWKSIPRNDIFLATKVGWDKGPYNTWYTPSHMRQNMERSLKNLKTDCVDLLYLHHCNFGKNGELFDGAIDTVRKLKEEGKTRFIGLSDWDLGKIMKYIEKADPDVVQPYRNVWDDNYKSSGLKKWIEEKNLGVCFFSPLKHGLLSGKYNEPPLFKDGDFRVNVNDFKSQKIIDIMKHNADQLRKKFFDRPHPVLSGVIDILHSDSSNSCVLLGQRNVNQVNNAACLGELLSDDEINWVRKLYDH